MRGVYVCVWGFYIWQQGKQDKTKRGTITYRLLPVARSVVVAPDWSREDYSVRMVRAVACSVRASLLYVWVIWNYEFHIPAKGAC